eukprot:10196443-Alexandrium_andersonii.AAC.1
MGLLEEVPAPPHPVGQRPTKQARKLAKAGFPDEQRDPSGRVRACGCRPRGRLELQNRFSALSESGQQCECSETHALFEETLEPE